MFKQANSLLKKIFSFQGDKSKKNSARPLQPFREGKHSSGNKPRGHFRMPGPSGTAGDKIKRNIKRGNHGIVHKHGVIAASIAETKRENWLRAHNKPIISLSVQ